MVATRAQLKQKAREQLEGNYGSMFLVNLVVGVILVAISGAASASVYYFPEISAIPSIVSLLVTPPFTISLILIYKNMTMGVRPNVGRIFDGFKQGYGGTILTSLLMSIYIVLWTILLIVPGIIKSYAYAMTMYIRADDPEMSANDCITRSREMMDGNKWRLFVLELSFIPWMLLSIVTLGIALIWVGPYIAQTMYNFYLDLKGGFNVQPDAEPVNEI